MTQSNTLTPEDIAAGFCAAVRTFANAEARWKERADRGLTDEDLREALKYELGIAGGRSASRNAPEISYQGTGLRIWIGKSLNPCIDPPTLSGASTIAMARKVFNIADPNDRQMTLF